MGNIRQNECVFFRRTAPLAPPAKQVKLRGRCTSSGTAGSLLTAVVLNGFAEVLPRHNQHSKAFAVVFVQFFVMYFMRLSQCAKVHVVGPGKPFDALMDDYFV